MSVDVMVGSAAGDDSVQWTAEYLQLCNWGGFHGYNQIPLDADSTLISGGSGTGKSTMMDSYIALMMPHTVAFNGASNAVKGRARNDDQRTILSYMRGKTDAVEDRETGEVIDHVLRGEKESVASGIAVTFCNDRGERFTAARLMFAKASAVRDTDVVKKWVTVAGRFDLEAAYGFAGEQFPPGVMRQRFSGLRFYDSYSAYAHALFASLGIGARGEGENALNLLARIQSGQQEATVDDLYKKLVLEVPSTYVESKKVIDHFDDLSQLYEELRRDQLQIDALSGIKALHETYQQNVTTSNLVAALDPEGRSGASTFELWSAQLRSELLASELESLQQQRIVAKKNLAAAVEKVQELSGQQFELDQQIRNNGGDALMTLERELSDLQIRLGQVAGQRDDFYERIAVLADKPTDAEEFDIMQVMAEDAITSIDDEKSKFDQQRRAAVLDGGALAGQLREIEANVTSLQERKGSRIDVHLSNRRDHLAQAAGLSREELPFIAELLDVHHDDERWRTAAEAVMGGFVRNVVFDKAVTEHFTRSIDGFPPKGRIQFEGVPLDQPSASPAHPRTLAGKLVFKDGPFKGWLQAKAAELFPHECVESPVDLLDDGKQRVTVAGQERRRLRGAHGVPNRKDYVIGFSNVELIAELQAEIGNMKERLGEHLRIEQRTTKRIEELDRERRAHEEVLRVTWTSIDVASIEARIAANNQRQQHILDSASVLAALRAQKELVDKELEGAYNDRAEHRLSLRNLTTTIDELDGRRDSAIADGERLHSAGAAALREQQMALLEPMFADIYTGDVQHLDGAIGTVRKQLGTQIRRANDAAATARAALERTFSTFKSVWDHYDWGVSIESYRDYCDHLDALETTGLANHRDQFAQKVARWSGADLVELRRAFRNSKEGIANRLDAVNRILCDIPFGAGRDRLQIRLRWRTNQQLTKFLTEMAQFASAATDIAADEMSSDEIDARYRSIQAFIRYLLPTDRLPKGEMSICDELLDVRRHAAIVAERVDKGTDKALSSYNSLGGKSGGETQELMAFIVGAALRYQLGDEARSRPRFAPVLLDEGFIKADSQFAGRAVEAWRKLGFQLIVGSVIDKVSAIEPYVSKILQVTKSVEGYSHVSVFTGASTDPAGELATSS